MNARQDLRWRKPAACLFGALFATLMFAQFSPASADPPLTVKIASCAATGATVTGKVADSPGGVSGPMREFIAIPYAASPTGANRWQPPKTYCWKGDFSAAGWFSQWCSQGSGGAFTSEDCLKLNVFTPATGSYSKLPVMVWIHGGALTGGDASDLGGGPIKLVSQGVIVVTINYRLGAFGFLAHPALDAVSAHRTGNYGILDQQAALKWVKSNIAAFGGDPKNVTIFGQSAGGLSVMVHLLSPLSQSLFQKAIIQSGALYASPGPTPLATAASQGLSFASSLGCAGSGAAAAACLRKLSAQAILAKQSSLGQSSALLRVDGVVLTDTMKNLLSAGKFQKVPIMNGSNHDEMRAHLVGGLGSFGTGTPCNYQSNVTPGNYTSALSMFFGNAGSVAGVYPAGGSDLSANVALSAARTDSVFACHALRADQLIASHGGTLYAYEFNDSNAPDTLSNPVKLADGKIFPLGAFHGAEVQFLFPEPNPLPPQNCSLPYAGLTAGEKALASDMQTYWVSFAKTGNPNPSTGTKPPNWSRFTPGSPRMMSMLSGTPKALASTAFDQDHKCSQYWFGSSGF